MSKMTIESNRFGTLDIDTDSILEFPAGLIGLGGTRYALISVDPEGAFHWLHSVDDGSLALPVTNPWLFFDDFVVDLSDADTDRVAEPVARRLGHRPHRIRARGLQCEPPRADLGRRRSRSPGHQRGAPSSGARSAVRPGRGRAGGLAALHRPVRRAAVHQGFRTFQGGITVLIITRRAGERIMVGDEIVVEIMEMVGNSVRVGIAAPRSVPVYREEIYTAVRDENRAAVETGPIELPSPKV